MKRSGLCPKCSGARLLHVTQVADTTGEMGEYVGAPLKTGAMASSSKAWRLARVPNSPDSQSLFRPDGYAAGLVEAYVCRACGFTELYTRDPESIPVDGTVIRAIGPEVEEP
jgi:hypothetical protein